MKPIVKRCNLCGKVKHLSLFHRRKGAKDGRRAECAVCGCEQVKRKYQQNPERSKKYHRDRRKNFPEIVRRIDRKSYWKRTHGADYKWYENQLQEQDGKCAICGTIKPGGPGNRLVIDHDHETGRLRGLLCQQCNTGIGLFNDDVEKILKAVKYLNERNKKCQSQL